LRLDQVGKRYGIRLPWVVRDASLEIPPGGLVRFEGKNGSGKSTLLRVIAGVSTPSRGTVTGRPATGYVPERFPAALPFPAHEYLSHLGRVHGLTGPDLATRIDECLDRLGGRELAPVPLRNMSKGMCQKVAVAQALLPGAGLLVLDEAWTGLDVEAKAALDEAVAERLADGGSVVFVDHEPGRLARLGGERWRLENGHATRVTNGSAPTGSAPNGSAAGGSAAGGQPSSGAASPGAASSGAASSGAASSGAAEVPLVVIELTGEAPDVAGLPGVIGVQHQAGRLIVKVEREASDAVLRALLARNSVHVVRVGDGPPETEGDW
jgi:ABC-2 type transport system ATP-binding protein